MVLDILTRYPLCRLQDPNSTPAPVTTPAVTTEATKCGALYTQIVEGRKKLKFYQGQMDASPQTSPNYAKLQSIFNMISRGVQAS